MSGSTKAPFIQVKKSFNSDVDGRTQIDILLYHKGRKKSTIFPIKGFSNKAIWHDLPQNSTIFYKKSIKKPKESSRKSARLFRKYHASLPSIISRRRFARRYARSRNSFGVSDEYRLLPTPLVSSIKVPLKPDSRISLKSS